MDNTQKIKDKIYNEFYQMVESFKSEMGFNDSQLAQYLGVSRVYVHKLRNQGFNFKLETLIDLSLKMGRIPEVQFKKI